MATRFLSDAELPRLSGYPEAIADEDLVTYFRLDAEDLRWLRAEHRGPANHLGLALQPAPCPGSASFPTTCAPLRAPSCAGSPTS